LLIPTAFGSQLKLPASVTLKRARRVSLLSESNIVNALQKAGNIGNILEKARPPTPPRMIGGAHSSTLDKSIFDLAPFSCTVKRIPRYALL
jgi:hypothetical protein